MYFLKVNLVFNKKKSTNEALIELENYFKYQQANNQITCGIFFRAKKSFSYC